MNKERLGFDIEIEMKHLKKILNKDDSLTISSRFVKYLIEQVERVQELENIIYQDKRQAVLEGMYEQNKRYREALEFYADEGTYEVAETLPPTDEYQQPIEPVFKTVPIIYYDKGKEARKALEE